MAGSPAPSAVVTGAARGFGGKEIARRLVARGHHVLITDVDARAVAAAAAGLGGERRRVAAP
jgi:NAD(P)-dependent dehydrogenase (short-subunit alcohol dehydrogenase family)